MSKKHNREPNVLPSGQFEKPPEEFHEGTKFRVRDKDFENVWGENLAWADAEKLREKVNGSGRSRSARVTPMSEPDPRPSTIPTPDLIRILKPPAEVNEQLQQLRAPALATSAAAAAAANARLARRAPAPTVDLDAIRASLEEKQRAAQAVEAEAASNRAAFVELIQEELAKGRSVDDIKTECVAAGASADLIDALMLEAVGGETDQAPLDPAEVHDMLDELGAVPSDDEISRAESTAGGEAGGA